MPVIVRTFRSRPEREGEVMEGLRTLASATVRYGGGASIVICRQSNDPGQFVWIGDRGGQSDFRGLGLRDDLVKTFEESLAECSRPLSLGFLDEFYRFPPRPCQIWRSEVHAPAEEVIETMKNLLELSRLARGDRHVVGMSLYRAVEDAGTFVGFLALTLGFTPSQLVRNGIVRARLAEQLERTVVWHPLSAVCEVRRFPAGEAVTGRRQEISAVPFWVRSDVLAAPATPVDPQKPSAAAKCGAEPAAGSRVPAASEAKTP